MNICLSVLSTKCLRIQTTFNFYGCFAATYLSVLGNMVVTTCLSGYPAATTSDYPVSEHMSNGGGGGSLCSGAGDRDRLSLSDSSDMSSVGSCGEEMRRGSGDDDESCGGEKVTRGEQMLEEDPNGNTELKSSNNSSDSRIRWGPQLSGAQRLKSLYSTGEVLVFQ